MEFSEQVQRLVNAGDLLEALCDELLEVLFELVYSYVELNEISVEDVGGVLEQVVTLVLKVLNELLEAIKQLIHILEVMARKAVELTYCAEHIH